MADAAPPFTERLPTTLLRTGSLAVGVGVVAGWRQHRLVTVPLVTVFALWFTLGGHYVELLFRNRIGIHLGPTPGRALVRLVYWFVGGSVLYAAALTTHWMLTGRWAPWPWWIGGALFVAGELVIHLFMRVRRQPSFYDGRG